MNTKELTKEFTIYKFRHMINVIKYKMMQDYYKNKSENSIDLFPTIEQENLENSINTRVKLMCLSGCVLAAYQQAWDEYCSDFC